MYLFYKSSSTPLWSYTTGSDVDSVAISANGQYFTAGSYDNKVYLFSLENIINNITPTWNEIPTNETIHFGDSFLFNVNASDPLGIDHYTINDTINFNIDSSGTITNRGDLSIGTYWLEIRAYNPYDNYVDAVIKVTVIGKDKPPNPLGIPGFEMSVLLILISVSVVFLLMGMKNFVTVKR